MTDNRTTELLHKLLEERGVEYFTDDDERAYDEPARTTWDFVLCGLEMTVTATEFVDVEGKTYLEMDFHHAFTPEQAIAATVGSEREKRLEKLVRIYGEIGNYFCERFACCDAEFANCKYCVGLPQGGQCELGWCNDESKALGIEQPDCGGECEPVNLEELYDRIGELENELAERGVLTAEQVREAIERHSAWVIGNNRCFHDGAYEEIADELNAELGSGTCELEPLSALDVTLNMLGSIEWGACSECGCAVPMDAKFCNECGKAVKR